MFTAKQTTRETRRFDFGWGNFGLKILSTIIIEILRSENKYVKTNFTKLS